MSVEEACWTYSKPVSGLLPWQSYFLAFVIGLFAFRYPVSALVILSVLYIADTTLRERACRLPVLVFLCCAAFGFGYAAQQTPELPEHVPAWMENRQPVVVDGIVDRVEPRDRGRLRIVLRNVQCAVGDQMQSISGKVVWSWRHPKYDPEPGQTVRALLRIVPARGFGNPGGWDYEWYWQRQGVFWRAWTAGRKQPQWGERPSGLWTIKSRLRESVARSIPSTQGGAMVLALVTGDRSRLDLETMKATRAAGLAHTLALSGLHVGFVAAMGLGLAYLAGWICPSLLLILPRPKLSVLLAAPLVLGYAWLGQPSTSLIRAATMYGFWGILLLQGRGRVLMDGLFFALLVIILVSPLSVFDLSLQMSAVAVAGIGLMSPCFRSLFSVGERWWSRALGWIGGVLAICLIANVSLLPLVSWYFGTLSPNVLLNLIWLPTLGFVVMPLGLLGMLFNLMPWTDTLGGAFIGWSSWVMDWLLALLHLVDRLDLIPVFTVLRPMWPEIVGCGLLLIVALVVWGNGRRIPFGLAGIGFVLLVLPHVGVMVSDARDETRLTMLDVGLGQAVVVTLPGGHRWLVDGGGGSKTFDMGEAVVAPFLTLGRPPRLDGVFMTHPDSDHSHGLPFILSRFDVGSFYTNGIMPGGLTGKRMRKVLERRGIEPVPLRAGDTVVLACGAEFELLHPGEDFVSSKNNEQSLVMRLVRKGHPFVLLPGDVEKDGIASILESGRELTADVLVLPHHGSRTSHVPDFYRAVSPKVVLCSDGYLNRYGFPSTDVVQDVGVPVFTTSSHGQVIALWNFDEALSIRAFWP